MLQKLHEGHLGTDKRCTRSKTIMYWPNINDDIAEMVAKCSSCAKLHSGNQQEPHKVHEIALLPWQNVRADIFEFGGNFIPCSSG